MSILLKSLTSCRKRQSWGDGESLAALGVGDSARKFLIGYLFRASETLGRSFLSGTLSLSPFSFAPLSFSL